MNKSIKIQLSVVITGVLLILFTICMFIFIGTTERHFVNTADILSSQIGSLIRDNEAAKNALQESLKEEYISKAKALAYTLENDPTIQSNYGELCKIASLLDIDEINIFGKDGLIAYSTVKDYVGFSIYSGGQIAFFEPMMKDKTLELAQDLSPNTKEGKLVMYAAVWREDGENIIQVGITPERLLSALEENDISKVLDKMPTDSVLYFVYDKDTDLIVSSTDKELCGLSDAQIPFDLKEPAKRFRRVNFNGENYAYALRSYEHYTIAIFETRGHLFRDTKVTALLLFIFLNFFFAGVFLLVNFMTKREKKKEAGYVDRLSTYKRAILSDALISLEVNLNRDDLYYGVWKNDSGEEIQLSDILGLTPPCSYDEYIRAWCDRFVKNENETVFKGSTDREYLLNRFAEGMSEITFDYEAKTVSGKQAWLRRSICMTRDSSGDVIAYTNVKDISALINQTKREEAYVRALSTEYDSICVVDFQKDKNNDRVVLHSRISENVSSLVDAETAREENFVKKLLLFSRYVHPDDREQFLAEVKRENIFSSFAEDTAHIVNFRFGTSDRAYLYYQFRFVPLRDDDRIVGMIACIRNTDNEIRKEFGIRKELEDARIAAESANRAKSTFLFNMSHDIRTPMNAIIGFTDIAEKNIDDRERVAESLAKVRMAGAHLLSLINDVLDMSRVESGTVKIEESPISVDTSTDNLYSILNGTAEAKNIRFTSKISPSLTHRWIYADRVRMMRVLTNVISNSIKYTNPGGTIGLTVEELPCERSGFAHIRYTVTDTGIGMSKEFLEHVFEPFSRAESATRSGVIGTGLGMAITKSLVELMGGRVSIESEPGVGTTVRLEFENRIADEADVNGTVTADTSFDLSGKKVLLVEDNELNREIAIDILSENGMETDTAEDGDIAVEKMRTAEEGAYDFILMDIQMPRMNGYDATKAIRALPSDYAARVPIIAMTANAFDEDKQNAMAAGMNGHVAKPIDVPRLLATISELLG